MFTQLGPELKHLDSGVRNVTSSQDESPETLIQEVFLNVGSQFAEGKPIHIEGEHGEWKIHVYTHSHKHLFQMNWHSKA